MFSPFSLRISPMERLFLINFEKDPDDLYIGFEPQWFDDASYGTGLRIIAWRRDGYIDVYQQPGLTREDALDVAGKGLADTLERPMTDARFHVTSTGIDVAFAFEDKTGRAVEVEIIEKSRKPTRPFPLLAPVGSSSENPSFLPAYFMFQFDFVRRAHTRVSISINSRSHRADPFPFPLNGSRVYYMRYSADTFLVDWCPEQAESLEPLHEQEGAGGYGPNRTRYELSGDEELPTIARIQASHKHHTFVAEFSPAFPDISRIQDGTALQGKWTLGADPSAGRLQGVYSVRRSGDTVDITMTPSGGWEPQPKTTFLKFLFNAAKIFRQWPKTYRWTAQITLRDDAPPFMVSQWSRI